MLTRTLMIRLFKALNRELRKAGVKGEAGICGGAVMCLVFRARESTKDVDAVFAPTREIRAAVRKVGEAFDLPADWLNDAVKGYFHTDPPTQDVLNLSHLRIWAPLPDYLLAMKCISARFDTSDRDDVMFLLRHLDIEEPEKVFAIIRKYYPDRLIPPKTRFFIEEILSQ